MNPRVELPRADANVELFEGTAELLEPEPAGDRKYMGGYVPEQVLE